MTDTNAEDPTQTGELGPMPTPGIEPGEPNPGGIDAVPEVAEVVPADLDPDHNPAVEESSEPVRESLSEGEDTDTKATRGSGDEDGSSEEESPA